MNSGVCANKEGEKIKLKQKRKCFACWLWLSIIENSIFIVDLVHLVYFFRSKASNSLAFIVKLYR